MRSEIREGALSEERVERRLTAIFAADVAGYSRLMEQDEAGTLAGLRTHRRELVDAKIAEHNLIHTIAWFKEMGATFLSPGTMAVWVEGLRRAGLPEE